MVDSPQQVTTEPEQIQHDAVHRQEPLRVGGRGEPPHVSLALAGRLVRHLRAIVFVLPSTVHLGRHHGAVSCRVAPELVRDQPSRLTAPPIQYLGEEAPRWHVDRAGTARECRSRRRLHRHPATDTVAAREEIFGIAETQAEPVVQPHRVTDDLGRKPIAAVTENVASHQATLAATT